MMDWLKANKLYAAGSIIIIFALVYFIFEPKAEPNTIFETEVDLLGSEEQLETVNVEEEAGEEIVIVDVKGAVKKPGVYEAEVDERVIDLIRKAGGLTDTADEEKINFAIRVVDEMVIYVPEVGEEPEGQGEVISSAGTGGTEQNDGKVNINTANEAELQTLTGIGPSKAAAIIEFREKNGPFKGIEDLKLISGIGDKSFEKLQESIKVK